MVCTYVPVHIWSPMTWYAGTYPLRSLNAEASNPWEGRMVVRASEKKYYCNKSPLPFLLSNIGETVTYTSSQKQHKAKDMSMHLNSCLIITAHRYFLFFSFIDSSHCVYYNSLKYRRLAGISLYYFSKKKERKREKKRKNHDIRVAHPKPLSPHRVLSR
jgi:hypothetical protein